MNDLKTCF